VGGKAKRFYVYSSCNTLVGLKDAERHAEGAGKNETEAMMLREEGTKHVQHLAADRERYWRAVRKL
jgi:hypothetical protein